MAQNKGEKRVAPLLLAVVIGGDGGELKDHFMSFLHFLV